METRFCSNCRAELPPKADACPACGVFAGDLFDERSLRPRTRRAFLIALVVIVAAVAALLIWPNTPELVQNAWQKRSEPPKPAPVPQRTRVVNDRPGGARRAAGATINEAEAIRLLRSHLASTRTSPAPVSW